jgi:5,5'-dehydrodivanillate O-demethylase oxygenase subunit
MLSEELNARLTGVGPGTPGGRLLRCYWHPVLPSAKLDENPVQKVRLLGEDLVLYRDRSGNLGLIDEPCPHRLVSMEYGIPEPEGLRCAYHGWLFNHEGRCLEQPAEPLESTFKNRVTTKAYPVQEQGGLIFAYLGETPVPLLPRYDLFVWDNVARQIGVSVVPCNWVQCMENSLDPVHAEWLHVYYTQYAASRRGLPHRSLTLTGHKKIGFDRFEHGIIKRRVRAGGTEEHDNWRIGHPVIFPNMLRINTDADDYSFQIRVPMDDTHTYHIIYSVYRPGAPVPPQASVPFYEVPVQDKTGRFIDDFYIGQDFMAWAGQGAVTQRNREHLGESDIGVIMYRELLQEQILRVERGEDPMEVFRDLEQNEVITLPLEHKYDLGSPGPRDSMFKSPEFEWSHLKFSSTIGAVQDLYADAAERAARGEPILPVPDLPVVPVAPETHRSVVIIPPPKE